MLKVGYALCGRGIDLVLFGDLGGDGSLAVQEEHGQQPAEIALIVGNGIDRQVDDLAPRGVVHDNVRVGHGNVFCAAAADGRGGNEPDVLVDHVEEVEAGLARSNVEVVRAVPEEVDNVVLAVDDDRGRQEALDELDVDVVEAAGAVFAPGAAGNAGGHGLDVGQVEDGRGELVHLGHAAVHIDLFGQGHGVEELGVLAGRLALAKEEVATLLEGGIEDGEDGLLQYGLEVDEHVAAADEIELAEGRIRKHVVRRKDDHLSDALGDEVLVVFLDEVLGKPCRRHVIGNAFREDALARLLYGLAVHVRGKDLDVAVGLGLLEHFLEEDGQGIGFLARGAAGTPDADLGLVLAVPDDVVDGAVLELLEEFRVAEEAGHADEDVLDQEIGLARVFADELGKLAERGRMGDGHAPLNAPQDGIALVVGEVDAAASLQYGVDGGEQVLFRGGRGGAGRDADARIVDEVQDFLGNVSWRQHKVRQAGTDGAAGHAVELGAGRILHNGNAAVFLDGLEAARAVCARAGEHDGNGVFLAAFGQGGKEDVYGMVDDTVHLIGQVQGAILYGHVLLRRDEIDRVGFQGHLIPDLQHLHVGVLAEDFGHETLVVRRKVLDDDNGQAAVFRHPAEEFLQGLKAAGRGAKGNDIGHGTGRLSMVVGHGFSWHRFFLTDWKTAFSSGNGTGDRVLARWSERLPFRPTGWQRSLAGWSLQR